MHLRDTTITENFIDLRKTLTRSGHLSEGGIRSDFFVKGPGPVLLSRHIYRKTGLVSRVLGLDATRGGRRRVWGGSCRGIGARMWGHEPTGGGGIRGTKEKEKEKFVHINKFSKRNTVLKKVGGVVRVKTITP